MNVQTENIADIDSVFDDVLESDANVQQQAACIIARVSTMNIFTHVSFSLIFIQRLLELPRIVVKFYHF